MSNKPKSYEEFSLFFKKMLSDANKSDTTIFEGMFPIESITDELINENYEYFKRHHYESYINSNDYTFQKNVIKQSINESFFQETFTQVIDNIIQEGSLTYSYQVLLDNTVEQFNIDLDNLKMPGETQRSTQESYNQAVATLEENAYLGLVAPSVGAATGLFGGAIAGGIAFLVGSAVALWAPVNQVRQADRSIQNVLGRLGSVLTGFTVFKTLLKSKSIGTTYNNMINFDNIDADPAVIAMFKKISQSNNKSDVHAGLTTLVMSCIEQNKSVFDLASEDTRLDAQKNPRDMSLGVRLFSEIFANANSSSSNLNTLLRFRKCLSTKLVDTYKILLISNLENKKEYKDILTSIKKIGVGRVENILPYLSTTYPEEEALNKAIVALVDFRVYLMKLAKDLQSGTFTVDKESGKFLQQKIEAVDSDVENALKLRSRNRAPFEGNLMNRKPSDRFKKSFFVSDRTSI